MRREQLSSRKNKLLLACLFLSLAVVCVRCTWNRSPDPYAAGFVQSIGETELRGYSEALAAIGSRPENNQPKTDRTLRFIEETLKEAGYQPVGTRPAGSEEEPGNFNIVAEIRGTRRPESVVELGAHYDTVPFSPGADDNGSGVAGVLAVARALSPDQCAKTIRFVFYTAEEGGMAGSLVHARNIVDNHQEHFEGVIVFESIGYAVDEPGTQRTPIRIPLVVWPPRTGNFIAVVGNRKSTFIGKRFEQSAESCEPDLNLYSLKRMGGSLKDAARSDHASYWEYDLPALMLTDTANFRNPNYHQPSDGIDTLDFEFMTQVTRAAAATLFEWAEGETLGAGGREGGQQAGNALTFWREPCKRANGAFPPMDASVGLPTNGISREEACREIVTRYWNAAIHGDDEVVSKLWCAWPSGGVMNWHEQSLPQKLLDVGESYRQEGCHFGTPTLVTPSRVQFSNGEVKVIKLIVIFRDLGMEESCVIVGIWNG